VNHWCQTSSLQREAHSIYQEPWFLDATAGEGWSEARVVRDGVVVGRMPYTRARRNLLTHLGQPALGRSLGPWVRPFEGSPKKALNYEHEILADLEAQLPPCDRFMQAFAPAARNALAFHWAGYDLRVRYTYQLDLRPEEDQLWSSLAESVRTDIDDARRRVAVRSGLPIDRFHDVWRGSFARRGKRAPHSAASLERLQVACAKRNACEVLYAVDDRDRIEAVNFFVWSGGLAHVLLTGAEGSPRSGAALALLFWEAVRRARERAACFDFSGSTLPGEESLLGGFGAGLTPYLHVQRDSRRMQALSATKGVTAVATGAVARVRERPRTVKQG
jgi:hypothetical protein